MAILRFYSTFKDIDYYGATTSIYNSDLGNRIINSFMFNRQGELRSLLLFWLYYYHRKNSGFYLNLLTVPAIGLMALIAVATIISAITCLALVPTVIFWPTMLAMFSQASFILIIYLIAAYAASAVILTGMQINAFMSYFSSDTQYRKTPTVIDYILRSILDDELNINRIDTVARAINVIYGSEKKHCAYEIIDILRRSGFTRTHNGAKRLTALIRAFAQLGIFNEYRACLSDNTCLSDNIGNYDQIRLISSIPSLGKGIIIQHTIVLQYNRYQLNRIITNCNDARMSFYTTPYNIATIEALVRELSPRIISAAEQTAYTRLIPITPPAALAPHQCSAIVELIRNLDNNQLLVESHTTREMICIHRRTFRSKFRNEQEFSLDQKEAYSLKLKAAKMVANLYQHKVLEVDEKKSAIKSTKLTADITSEGKKWAYSLSALISYLVDDKKSPPAHHKNESAPSNSLVDDKKSSSADYISMLHNQRKAYSSDVVQSILDNDADIEIENQVREDIKDLFCKTKCLLSSNDQQLERFFPKKGHYLQFKYWCGRIEMPSPSTAAHDEKHHNYGHKRHKELRR